MLEPLQLALHPGMPFQTPRSGSKHGLFGYQLRLVDGPTITNYDPLLGDIRRASVEAVEGESGDGGMFWLDRRIAGEDQVNMRPAVDPRGSNVRPDEPYTGFWDSVAYRVPWALLLILGVVVYVVIERWFDDLSSKDSIDAITGLGVLAIGHGVQHHVHYQRIRAKEAPGQGERSGPPERSHRG